MSERPFMQLYVSDFVGDTLTLTTEHIGAYLLLLIALWNADGALDDDEEILAVTARLPIDRWRVIWGRLSKYFVIADGKVTHNRLTKELEKFASKSAARSEAGRRGGFAKALKDKNMGLANAMPLPRHLPEPDKKSAQAHGDPTEGLAVVAEGTDDFKAVYRLRKAQKRQLIVGKHGTVTITTEELDQARAQAVMN